MASLTRLSLFYLNRSQKVSQVCVSLGPYEPRPVGACQPSFHRFHNVAGLFFETRLLDTRTSTALIVLDISDRLTNLRRREPCIQDPLHPNRRGNPNLALHAPGAFPTAFPFVYGTGHRSLGVIDPVKRDGWTGCAERIIPEDHGILAHLNRRKWNLLGRKQKRLGASSQESVETRVSTCVRHDRHVWWKYEWNRYGISWSVKPYNILSVVRNCTIWDRENTRYTATLRNVLRVGTASCRMWMDDRNLVSCGLTDRINPASTRPLKWLVESRRTIPLRVEHVQHTGEEITWNTPLPEPSIQ